MADAELVPSARVRGSPGKTESPARIAALASIHATRRSFVETVSQVVEAPCRAPRLTTLWKGAQNDVTRGRTVVTRVPSGYEVDSIAQYPDGEVQALQVSLDIADPTARERECRPLEECAADLPEADRLLVDLKSVQTSSALQAPSKHAPPGSGC